MALPIKALRLMLGVTDVSSANERELWKEILKKLEEIEQKLDKKQDRFY